MLFLQSQTFLVQLLEGNQTQGLVILQHCAHPVRHDPQLGDDLLDVLQYPRLVQPILFLDLLAECEAEPPEVFGLLQQTQLDRVLQLFY